MARVSVLVLAMAVVAALAVAVQAASSSLLIGRGIYDMTGPASDVNFMGYANPKQVGGGIHFRQRARAFIFGDATTGTRAVFVSVDACMGSQALKTAVVEKLATIYGDLYTAENVGISGIHTHSTPGGFLQYVLFDITSLGFVKQSLDAYVTGVVEAIKMAHDNFQPAHMYINTGNVSDANINRSPTAYLNNPAWERAQYEHNTDHLMVLTKMVAASSGEEIGMLNWYAVHGTSMNNTNKLVSGDNKGYASMTFEAAKNPPGTFPGMGSFVGAFAQTNLGDVSPNTDGPHCLDTGKACNTAHSTCDGKNELCVGSGPGKDMFQSTQIIGQRQVDVAMELYETATEEVTGPVRYIHTTVNMENYTVYVNGTAHNTCKTAMGYSFAAGTTDGPGAFNFEQGDNSTGNPFWNVVRDLLAKPSPEMIACHHPKPILLATGEISEPYAWDPPIVEVQIIQVGQLFILVVPGEFTTMAGRRLRDRVKHALIDAGAASNSSHVVIAGLANTYASYVTTHDEYQVQRYEGASTIYGPWEAEAYNQIFEELAIQLAEGKPATAGPAPPNLLSKQLEFLPGVIVDGAPLGHHIGEVVTQPAASYAAGDMAEVTFYSACLRNNLMTQSTFLTVERDQGNGNWTVVAMDSNWETRMYWYRHSELSWVSYAHIEWYIPSDAAPGDYRITHSGYKKELFDKVEPFSGTSNTFKVTAPVPRRFL